MDNINTWQEALVLITQGNLIACSSFKDGEFLFKLPPITLSINELPNNVKTIYKNLDVDYINLSGCICKKDINNNIIRGYLLTIEDKKSEFKFYN